MTHLKIKKWYKRLTFHFLDVEIANSWLLYRRTVQDCSIQFAKYKLHVATALIMSEKGSESDVQPTQIEKEQRKLPVKASSVIREVRYDRTGHFPRQASNVAQRCKYEGCKRKSTYMCLKCRVYLCIDIKTDCFYRFHNLQVV